MHHSKAIQIKVLIPRQLGTNITQWVSKATEGIHYGNVPGHPLEHTYCSQCNNIVVKRYGFDIQGWNMNENNNCKFCGNKIPITGKLAENYKRNRFQFVF